MKRRSAPVLGIGLTATVAAAAMFPAVSVAATRPVELAARQTVNTIGDGPASVAIADMNGDGRADIVTANALSGSVSVLTKDAAGTGWTTTVVGTTGGDPEALAVGDLNADGRPDIATADSGSDAVTVLTKDAAGTGYTRTTAGSTGDAPHDVAIGDLNADGRPDIATADAGSDTVSILTKDVTGGPGYTASTAGTTGDRPLGLVLRDLNGDGLPDLATANGDAASVSVLRNAGTTFSTTTAGITSAFPFGIAAADVDGDGNPELITSNASAGTATILHRESVLGGWTTSAVGNAGSNARSIAVGDLNRDGLPDLLFGNRSTNGLSLNDGISVVVKDADAPGYLAGPHTIAGDRPSDVAIGDVDGDGTPDVVTADTGDDTVSIFRNVTPAPAPASPVTTTTTTPADPVAPATPAAPAPAAPAAPASPAKPAAPAPKLQLGTPRVTNGGRVIRIPATVSAGGVLSAIASHAAPSGTKGGAASSAERLVYAGLSGRRVSKGGTYSLVLRRTAAGRSARFAQRRITLSVVVESTAADGRVVKQRRTVRVPVGR